MASFWCDMTGCREHNMPPAVLARECPMSDKLNAMFSNPWYFVVEDVSCTCFVYLVPLV